MYGFAGKCAMFGKEKGGFEFWGTGGIKSCAGAWEG